jgi:hypothetical protein
VNIESENWSLKVYKIFICMYGKRKMGEVEIPDTLWCGRNNKRIKYVTGSSSEWVGGGGVGLKKR